MLLSRGVCVAHPKIGEMVRQEMCYWSDQQVKITGKKDLKMEKYCIHLI